MIVIQCATPFEFDALKKTSGAIEVLKVGKRQFFQIGDKAIVLRGSVGKVWAAASAEFAITKWNPSLVIDFGAAGALARGLRVGDLVFATTVLEHDVISAMAKKPVVRTALGKGILPAGHEDVAEYPAFSQSTSGLRVTKGVLAAGDRDVQTLEERNTLALSSGAIAVTWESSAVGRICVFHGVDYISIRVITDIGSDEFLAEYKKGAGEVLLPAAEMVCSLI